MATAEHKFQKLIFKPANQKSIDFADELQKLAEDAFGIAAYALIEQFIYAKMPSHLKKTINRALLENGTYEQVVPHLAKELKLNGLEAPDELQRNTVSQYDTNTNADKPKSTCHHCKTPALYRNQCRLLKNRENNLERFKFILETKTVMPTTLFTTTTILTTITIKQKQSKQKAKNCFFTL